MSRSRVQLDKELFYGNVVPSWEHQFGLRLAHDEFAHASTVGQVWTVIEQRLVAQLGKSVLGLTAAGAISRTFYHLCRTLMAQGLARADVTPQLPLGTLFPWGDRPARWRQWQQLSQLPLPALRTSAAEFVALWVGTMAATWSLAPSWGQSLALGLCTAMVAALYGVGRRALPARTLAELTIQVVTTQYGALLHPALRNNRGEWRDVVLAGLAQCGPEGLTPDELYEGTAITWEGAKS